MKKLMLLGLTFLSISAHAKLSYCGGNESGPRFEDGVGCVDGGHFAQTAYNSRNSQPLYFYRAEEVDAIAASLSQAQAVSSSTLNSTFTKKFSDLEERTFVIEETLQKEIEIPASLKNELKRQIIEELKQNFILTPKN